MAYPMSALQRQRYTQPKKNRPYVLPSYVTDNYNTKLVFMEDFRSPVLDPKKWHVGSYRWHNRPLNGFQLVNEESQYYTLDMTNLDPKPGGGINIVAKKRDIADPVNGYPLVNNAAGYSAVGAAPTPKAYTATAADDVLTIPNHGWTTGQAVWVDITSGTLGILPFTVYYVINTGTNTIKLASTSQNATNGTAINFTSDGAGTVVAYTSSTIAIDGITIRPVIGSKIRFAGHDTEYRMASMTGSPPTSMVIVPALTHAIVDNEQITSLWEETSGLITTYGKFAKTRVFIEALAKVPYGRGIWSALWCFSDRPCANTEWDIHENPGGDAYAQAYVASSHFNARGTVSNVGGYAAGSTTINIVLPTFTVYSLEDNSLDLSRHIGLHTGLPVRVTSTGTLPGGLAENTTYYAIYNAGYIKLATSAANALAGTAINITDNGTGTHKINVYSTRQTGVTPGANTAIIRFNEDLTGQSYVVQTGSTLDQLVIANLSGGGGLAYSVADGEDFYYLYNGGAQILGTYQAGVSLGENIDARQHKWGIVADDTYLKFYCDDVLGFQAFNENPQVPMYFAANVATKGSWGGYVLDNTKMPAAMQVEWVRAYELEAA